MELDKRYCAFICLFVLGGVFILSGFSRVAGPTDRTDGILRLIAGVAMAVPGVIGMIRNLPRGPR